MSCLYSLFPRTFILLPYFSMNHIFNIIWPRAFFVFCLLGATESQSVVEQSYPVDVSVYDGQGSLLIQWTYPDSILVGKVKLFVQESGETDFELLSELPSDQSLYLDLDCQPNTRYFFKIHIEDLFGKLYTSDTITPVFGTCIVIEDSSKINNDIHSLSDLIYSQILNSVQTIDSYSDFSSIIDLLKSTKQANVIWIEDYPLQELNSVKGLIAVLDLIIQDKDLLKNVLDLEIIYSNRLFIFPENWQDAIQNEFLKIKDRWSDLFFQVDKAIEKIELIEPIRIIGFNLLDDFQNELILYLFHPEQISSSEIFLLSKNEYLNIGEYLIEKDLTIKVLIPKHWKNVDLMMDDIFIQTIPLIFEESISFTLNGDFIPWDESISLKVGRTESTLWFNEMTWNPFSKTLQLEVAGNPNYDDQYSLLIHGESIWDIESLSGFEIQIQDSSIVLQDEIEIPLVLSFVKNENNHWNTIEYIILDTLPLAISRMPNGGAWNYTDIVTLGITNDPSNDFTEADLLPELFVLYQNYPNPFNGQTRITFDLLEDATVSMYITDATGRIHDKFLESDFITSGTYNYSWNGDGRSSGIYFFTIYAQVENHPPTIFSRKMIYLK